MNNHPPYFYDTEVEWTNHRRGDLRAPGLPTLEVAAPPEFKGPEGIWTPEHLYVASVNSCFMTTFLASAELLKLDLASITCQARGTLEKDEGRGYRITRITLRPKLVIRHDCDAKWAARLIEKAGHNCLISNSINTVVQLEPEIISQWVEEAYITSGASLIQPNHPVTRGSPPAGVMTTQMDDY